MREDFHSIRGGSDGGRPLELAEAAGQLLVADDLADPPGEIPFQQMMPQRRSRHGLHGVIKLDHIVCQDRIFAVDETKRLFIRQARVRVLARVMGMQRDPLRA